MATALQFFGVVTWIGINMKLIHMQEKNPGRDVTVWRHQKWPIPSKSVPKNNENGREISFTPRYMSRNIWKR